MRNQVNSVYFWPVVPGKTAFELLGVWVREEHHRGDTRWRVTMSCHEQYQSLHDEAVLNVGIKTPVA
jgi:hypothetical protein